MGVYPLLLRLGEFVAGLVGELVVGLVAIAIGGGGRDIDCGRCIGGGGGGGGGARAMGRS
jgi:hypothetical protein